MENSQDDLYSKGYLAGYRDGIRDVINGKRANITEISIENLPISAMALSTHAKNCLTRAGCSSVSDVVALDEHTIAITRSMGPKTASEIAHWLNTHGFSYTAWHQYL